MTRGRGYTTLHDNQLCVINISGKIVVVLSWNTCLQVKESCALFTVLLWVLFSDSKMKTTWYSSKLSRSHKIVHLVRLCILTFAHLLLLQCLSIVNLNSQNEMFKINFIQVNCMEDLAANYFKNDICVWSWLSLPYRVLSVTINPVIIW